MDVSCLPTKKTAVSLPCLLSPPNPRLKQALSMQEGFCPSSSAGPGARETTNAAAPGQTQGTRLMPGLSGWPPAWPVHSTHCACLGGDGVGWTEHTAPVFNLQPSEQQHRLEGMAAATLKTEIISNNLCRSGSRGKPWEGAHIRTQNQGRYQPPVKGWRTGRFLL